MKLLVPLYIYPVRDGELALEWRQMKEASEAGVPVVAIVNPGSGPGTEADRPSYERGMQALRDSDIEVVGYVATGYGERGESQVKGDIDRYKEWYGRWLTGVFVDETSHAADDLDRGDGAMCAKYKEYRQHVQRQMGEAATVVMNTGSMLTESALTGAVGGEVVWNVLEDSLEKMEKAFGRVVLTKASKKSKEKKGVRGGGGSNKTSRWGLFCFGGGSDSDSDRRSSGGAGASCGGRRWKTVAGTPPGAPAHVKGRAAFMVHSTKGLSYEVICHWVGQLQDGGWTHAYMTDKVFDPTSRDPVLHNPWDALPTYWGDLVRAVAEVSEPDSGGEAGTPSTTGSSSSSPRLADCCFGLR